MGTEYSKRLVPYSTTLVASLGNPCLVYLDRYIGSFGSKANALKIIKIEYFIT